MPCSTCSARICAVISAGSSRPRSCSVRGSPIKTTPHARRLRGEFARSTPNSRTVRSSWPRRGISSCSMTRNGSTNRLMRFLPSRVGIRSDAGEKLIADLGDGGGLGFLAVWHHTEQRDFAEVWEDTDVCSFGQAMTTAGGVVEHEAGDLQSTCVGLANGQQSVIEGAEAEAGDDYYLEFQGFREVGDEVILPDWDEEAPCPFDEDHIVAPCQLLVRAKNPAEVDVLAFDFCRHTRRQRIAQIDGVDDVERLLVIHDRGVDFGVVSSAFAAGDGFEGGGGEAAAAEVGEQRGGDVRFADARVRSRDEYSPAHYRFSVPQTPAVASTASSGVMGTRNRLLDSGPEDRATKYRSNSTGTIDPHSSRFTPRRLRRTTTSNAAL